MAPNWIATVKSLVKLFGGTPSSLSVMIICPVEDTGRYSVIPSTIAMIIASIVFMGCFAGF
jgi:hypothetical protein